MGEDIAMRFNSVLSVGSGDSRRMFSATSSFFECNPLSNTEAHETQRRARNARSTTTTTTTTTKEENNRKHSIVSFVLLHYRRSIVHVSLSSDSELRSGSIERVALLLEVTEEGGSGFGGVEFPVDQKESLDRKVSNWY